MVYQQHVLDVLEKLVKDGKYDTETIKTKCCVDVDEETGDIDGLDGQGPLCIGMRVAIGELTAEQWISMRVPVPKRKKMMCCA